LTHEMPLTSMIRSPSRSPLARCRSTIAETRAYGSDAHERTLRPSAPLTRVMATFSVGASAAVGSSTIDCVGG
jgi:hypothetical protein